MVVVCIGYGQTFFSVWEGARLCGDIQERFHAVCLCYRVFSYLLFDIIHDMTVVFFGYCEWLLWVITCILPFVCVV